MLAEYGRYVVPGREGSAGQHRAAKRWRLPRRSGWGEQQGRTRGTRDLDHKGWREHGRRGLRPVGEADFELLRKGVTKTNKEDTWSQIQCPRLLHTRWNVLTKSPLCQTLLDWHLELRRERQYISTCRAITWCGKSNSKHSQRIISFETSASTHKPNASQILLHVTGVDSIYYSQC